MHLSIVQTRKPRHAPAPEVLPPDPTEELSDAELVAALIAQGEAPRAAAARAHALLDSTGGLYGLQRAGLSHLASAGLTDTSIDLVRAALALGNRAAVARAPARALDAMTVAALFRPLLSHLAHEEMHLVLLDAQGRYRGRRRLASGGIATCSIFTRDVLAPVVESKAPAFVLVHNHPSGACVPSHEDTFLTGKVLLAADALGTRLVDHLVVAEDGYASAMPDGPQWTHGRSRTRTQ